MIPRLYEYNDTSFSNYGICALVDATYCAVTEERNGEFVLDLEYPRFGQWANELTVDRIILADPRDNAQAQPFRITQATFDMNGSLNIHAEHISYQLNQVIIGHGTTATFNSAAGMWNALNEAKIAGANPFTFTSDTPAISGGSISLNVDDPEGLRSFLGGDPGTMCEVFNGEFEFDRYAVKLLKARGSDRGVKIAYSKNLTGLTYDVDMEGCITGVVVFWTDGTTYRQNAQAITHGYAFNHFQIVDASDAFETAPPVSALREYALNWLQENAVPPTLSVEVEFVPLWQTDEYKDFYGLEHVGLCDTVEVLYPPLNIDVKAKVVRTVYDVLKDRYIEMTISTIKKSLADTIYDLMRG